LPEKIVQNISGVSEVAKRQEMAMSKFTAVSGVKLLEVT